MEENDFIQDSIEVENLLENQETKLTNVGKKSSKESRKTGNKINMAKIEKEKVHENENQFVETPPEFIDS